MVDSYNDLLKYAPSDSEPTGPTAPSVSGSTAIPQAPASVPASKAMSGGDAYGGLMKYAPQEDSPQQAQPDTGIIQGLPAMGAGAASDSPLTVGDRAKLSLGNTKGNLEYLKQRFPGNVAQDTDGTPLISDGKTWYRADEKSDAWELSKKLVTGAIKGNPLFIAPRALAHSIAPSMVDAPSLNDFNYAKRAQSIASDAAALTGPSMTTAGMVGGGAAGGALAGGSTAGLGAAAGAVAGAGIGAGAAEGIRTSLGRVVGTYQATPEEQLQDAGWEALLGAGGEVVGLGAKPVLGTVSKALKNFSEYATPWVKENFASIMEKMGSGDAWSIRRGMDNHETVTGAVKEVLGTTGIDALPEEKIAEAANRQITTVKTMAEQSKAALQRNYQQAQQSIISSAPSTFKADPGQIMKEVQQEMADNGFGLMDQKTGNFRTFTKGELAQKFQTEPEMLPKLLGENSEAAVKRVADMTNQWKQISNLNGPKGAQMLLNFKRAFGEAFSDFAGNDVPQEVKRLAFQLKDSVEQKIGQRFADSGLGETYTKMNADYASKKDAVDLFNNAVRDGNVEGLVKKLAMSGKSGKFRTLNGEAKIMADLLGDNGHSMMQRVFDLEASKAFFPIANKGSAGNAANQVMRGAGKLMGAGNPSAALGKLPYANQLSDFLKVNASKSATLLRNDQAMRTLLDSTIQGYLGEGQAKDQLLNQAHQYIQSSQLPPIQGDQQ